MKKLPEVEQAKALMNEAKDWGVWRWLTDKRRVRSAADRAVELLNELDRQARSSWSEDLAKAYSALEDPKRKRGLNGLPEEIKEAARGVKEAADIAEAARLDAEATFDEAERHMSTSLAREGAQKAIESWELREKSIRKAEAAARQFRGGGKAASL